ncbi:MAG: hypothetical protein AMXMBFR12_05980 [Candidatus Babeliales bacterium]
MKTFVHFVIFLFAIQILESTTFSMQTPVNVCILCAPVNGKFREYVLLDAHYLNYHLCNSRWLYMCNKCNYAGSANEIKSHIEFKHKIRLRHVHTLAHIRVPHLPKDENLGSIQMQNYSTRLYALLENTCEEQNLP